VEQVVQHPAGEAEPAEALIDGDLPDEQAGRIGRAAIADHEARRHIAYECDPAGRGEIAGVEHIRVRRVQI
jgi:hypothetical protein